MHGYYLFSTNTCKVHTVVHSGGLNFGVNNGVLTPGIVLAPGFRSHYVLIMYT